MVAIGDSKTVGYLCCTGTGGYRDTLAANLTADVPGADAQWLATYAVGGITTATVAAGIDSFLGALNDQNKEPGWVLVNLGSNDLGGADGGSLTQAAWSADFAYILDAVHTKWASAQVRVALPYWANLNTGMTRMDDTWIPAVLASRAAWAAVGPDERTYLIGHLIDATHPDATGYALTAAEWQTAMGY